MLTPRVSKLILTAHITFSVAWFGAVAAFLALAITGLRSNDPQMVRSVYLAMQPATSYVIVPFAFASLLTGLLVSLGTKWGLFRYYWVTTKLVITVPIIALLLTHTKLISFVAGAAAQSVLSRSDLHGERVELASKAGLALLPLLVTIALGVYKPWGPAEYGRRKLRKVAPSLAESELLLYTPNASTGLIGKRGALGFKLFYSIAILLVLILVALHVTGHGLHHGH